MPHPSHTDLYSMLDPSAINHHRGKDRDGSRETQRYNDGERADGWRETRRKARE